MVEVKNLRGLLYRITMVTILAMIQLSLVAQKGLKRSVTNGDTSYYTAEKKIYAKPGSRNAVGEILKTTFYRYPDRYSLCFFIQTGRTSHFSITKGEETILEWDNGDNVFLTCRNSSESKPSRLDYGGWMYVFYSINPSQLDELKKKPLKHIRIKSSTGWMYYELTEKNAKQIMEQATAITQDMRF